MIFQQQYLRDRSYQLTFSISKREVSLMRWAFKLKFDRNIGLYSLEENTRPATKKIL